MSSPNAISRCTAMMSARGTMTSTIRRSRNPRMLLSILRSVGEKPVSPAGVSSTSLRSARMVLGFQPKIARSARASQPSPLSRVAWLGRDTGTGKFRDEPAAADGSLGIGESVSGMAIRCQPSASRAMYGSGTPSRARMVRSSRSIASASSSDS